MTAQRTTIELFKEEMKFSAGHFTILSPTERERLHGHNFTVYVAITGIVGDDGLMSEYGAFKRILFDACRGLNEYFLLPGESPHLTIREEGDHLFATFNGEVIPFLRRDVKILPIRNVTIEELARWFAHDLVDGGRLVTDDVEALVVKVASGPGQYASYEWRRAQ
ncbi:MAG: 6-carboxytetrahydropterin synthase [Myxococcales bacterium]|nr:6-carboxytetrahydropterin synthase [Myxococcales bacterium]